MIKVMIIDDDFITRTKLNTIINWPHYNYEICGVYSNPKNAIENIENDKPDIVITDMSMPILNGVDVIRFLKKEYPSIKTIALSAYDDFDYVRESLKLKAVDYILKNQLNAEELLSVLNTAVKEIEKENNESINRSKLNEELSTHKYLVNRELINKIMNKEFEDENLLKSFIQYFDIKDSMGNLIILALEIDDYETYKSRFTLEDENKFIRSYTEIIKESVFNKEDSIIEYISKGQFLIIINNKKEISLGNIDSKTKETTEKLISVSKRYFNVTISLGISSLCHNVKEILKYVFEANYALKEKFSKGKGKIYKGTQSSIDEIQNFYLSSKDQEKIYNYIIYKEEVLLKEHIEYIFSKIAEMNITRENAREICIEIMTILYRVLKENGFVIQLLGYSYNPIDYIEKLETAEDQKNYLLEISLKIIGILSTYEIRDSYSKYTREAIKYINENFKNNISLTDVSNKLGISSAYLSHTFKSDYPKGFVEYLNLVRVQYAKFLINSGEYTLKEIVGEAGFSSYNYFFKIFKSITGVTPTQFKDTSNSSFTLK
ncbi:response regulator [Clostridium cellulovorans]|uniref:Stage 0 sporulation protein A homolog n=1 Tax=Clostridium cellulovorans (strain ATCC 35296 / DSM 3052 / OCM 3 / 743B) TaxID=573061 RepID=D9SLU1_CLOC7|nr:response regulator [Clostridium cellulovorans]ADL53728.1 two component transcriptional regulator, AraC family [Clostridium cellulovorans 743B]